MKRQLDTDQGATHLTTEKIPESARSEVARILARLAIRRYLRLTQEYNKDDRSATD